MRRCQRPEGRCFLRLSCSKPLDGTGRPTTASSSRTAFLPAQSHPVLRSRRESEKRMLARASASVRPMARSTCDASVAPLWHAEPALTASPCRSSAITSSSALMPSKRTDAVPHRRFTFAGIHADTDDACSCRPSTQAWSRSAGKCLRARPPRATSLREFRPHGPGRRCRQRSPCRRGGGARGCRHAEAAFTGTPLRTHNAPTPCGPCILWPETESRSHPKRAPRRPAACRSPVPRRCAATRPRGAQSPQSRLSAAPLRSRCLQASR